MPALLCRGAAAGELGAVGWRLVSTYDCDGASNISCTDLTGPVLEQSYCCSVEMQEAGKKRPAAGQLEQEERHLLPQLPKPQQQQQAPEERCCALLQRFKLAVGGGSNPFFPALLAADGSERLAAGAALSACSQQAALAYFDGLLGGLKGSVGNGSAGPQANVQQASAPEQEEQQMEEGEAAAGPAGAAASALSPADVAEYVRLAERVPQLRGSLRSCKRQGPGCCDVGKARKFVCCLQSWNALSSECAARWDALYARRSR